MRVNQLFFFCILFFFSLTNSQINISGTVQNSSTKEPVEGATVKLIGLDITTVTDKNGNFNISKTSVQKMRNRQNGRTPIVRAKDLFYQHETNSPIQIRVLDLSGKEVALIFSGSLLKGFWQISPPQLSPGTYLFSFRTPVSHHIVRYLSIETGAMKRTGKMQKLSDVLTSSSAVVANQNVSLSAIDSLMIEKINYRTSYILLDNYQQTALKILLEDTTSSGTEDATIIPDPSWTCYMPDGIPPPERGEAVFSIDMEISEIHDVGITQFGHRRQFDIKGGTINSDRISGSVITGGLDYELTLENGSIELEQIVILRASNTYILMRNAGVAPIGSKSVRVVLDFEAPNSSSYAWLNSGKFAADRIVDTIAKTIKLEVFDISNTALTEKHIQIKDPEDMPNQTWDCVKLTGTKGSSVFTENVALGSSISIGASKRGNRNIIPITGGTTSGLVAGNILSGGADYQLSGLDARYTLAPNDGELIIVRNCGAMGKLIPVFEARADGPYAFLNENKYISSDPGMGAGGVSITFYEYK